MAGPRSGARTRSGRRRWSGLAVLLVTLAATLMLAAAPEPAAALCEDGDPSPYYSIWGQEHPRTGTCDGDRIYRGTLHDTRDDALCPILQFHDGGVLYRHAYACTLGGVAFTWYDQTTGPSAAYERMCARGTGECNVWWPTVGY